MKKIKEVDDSLSKILLEFNKTAGSLEFNILGDLSDEKMISEQVYSGVYKIDIKNDGRFSDFQSWIGWFKEEWEHKDYVRKFTPNIKKKRVKCHTSLEEWIPLYLGKSKNIAGRVMGHLYLGLEQPTTGLKIKSRKNMFNQHFRLSTIRVDVNNYDLIMPIIEREQRNKFNPIVGRQ